MSNDENNLPKWAQYELQKLRAQVIGLEGALTIARAEAPKKGATGKVQVSDLVGPSVWLQDRAQIEFYLGAKQRNRIRVGLRERNSQTVVDVNGDNSLRILPNASNSIYLTLDE